MGNSRRHAVRACCGRYLTAIVLVPSARDSGPIAEQEHRDPTLVRASLTLQEVVKVCSAYNSSYRSSYARSTASSIAASRDLPAASWAGVMGSPYESARAGAVVETANAQARIRAIRNLSEPVLFFLERGRSGLAEEARGRRRLDSELRSSSFISLPLSAKDRLDADGHRKSKRYANSLSHRFDATWGLPPDEFMLR